MRLIVVVFDSMSFVQSADPACASFLGMLPISKIEREKKQHDWYFEREKWFVH
jgi:hypothetical protein